MSLTDRERLDVEAIVPPHRLAVLAARGFEIVRRTPPGERRDRFRVLVRDALAAAGVPVNARGVQVAIEEIALAIESEHERDETRGRRSA
jgi:hypothetical protein